MFCFTLKVRGYSKEGSNNSIVDRPTSTSSSSSSTKSRIPRTTSASQKSVNGSGIARINEPLQLRGPNTATVFSVGNSSEIKLKDPSYRTNRSMATSRGKDAGLSSVRRTDVGRMAGNNPAAIYKSHSMLDSSKVLVR